MRLLCRFGICDPSLCTETPDPLLYFIRMFPAPFHSICYLIVCPYKSMRIFHSKISTPAHPHFLIIIGSK